MKLDPRIKSLSDILTCFDIEEAKQYIGQKGYFALNIGYYNPPQNPTPLRCGDQGNKKK